MGKRVGGWKLQPTLKTSQACLTATCVCVCVCVCVTCSRFLIARQKISYLSALRDGKEGGRVEAATHTQNISRKTMPDCDLRVCVCVCVCVCV